MFDRERLLLVAGLLIYAFGGYYGIGLGTDPASAATLATPLDARIPFVPESIYVYAAVYVLILLPAFVVDSPALFRRTILAYGAVVTVCLLCFRLVPVSAVGLRPPLGSVEAGAFVRWGLALNYGLDPPVNLFPSLHLAGATIAALAAWKARRAYGAIALAAVAPVAVAVCTVKQHYWVDAAAGVLLAGASYAAILRPFTLPAGERAARGPGALLAFAAVLAGLYLVLYAAFRAGLPAPA